MWEKIIEALLEVLKYTLPSVVVFLTAHLLFKNYFKREYKLKLLEVRQQINKDTVPLRLQAYERMTMFLERIAPNNLIQRVRTSDMTAKELQIAMIVGIRQEFEHNLSQQIYITPNLWETISLVKDEMIKIINLSATSVPTTASSLDLSKIILGYFIESEQSFPTQKALDLVKAEVARFYFSD
jgi:hypothetical protein